MKRRGEDTGASPKLVAKKEEEPQTVKGGACPSGLPPCLLALQPPWLGLRRSACHFLRPLSPFPLPTGWGSQTPWVPPPEWLV